MTRYGHEEDDDEEFELGLPIEEVSNTDLSARDSEIHHHAASQAEDHLYADGSMSEAGNRQIFQHQVSDIADTCFEIQRTAEDFVVPELKEIHTKLDGLHRELQSSRDDIVKQHFKPMMVEMIKIVDDIRKVADYYQARKPSEDDRPKLIKHMESISSNLEDIFLWRGVTPFRCDDDIFDPASQKVLKAIETNDPAKDRKVAKRLRPGYEWEGRVIRPEMVAVYVYKAVSD